MFSFKVYLVANYGSTPMLGSILCFLEKPRYVCMIILFFPWSVASDWWEE